MTPILGGGGSAESVEVALNWPHCADYGDLLDAITGIESAEKSVDDAQGALEEADDAYRAAVAASDDTQRAEAEERLQDARIALRDAEADLLSATRDYETASVSALASAEATVADTGAQDDERNAAGDAVEAFAAVVDAARFAAFAETSAGLSTPTYDAAYQSALDAAWSQADTGRVTAELRVSSAEDALAEARRALDVGSREVVGA